jgi:hypothetical protein
MRELRAGNTAVLDGPDAPATPSSTDSGLAPSDQGLVNASSRARERQSGRTQVRNDITVEAIIDDLGNAQRIIEQSVTQRLRDEVLD